MIKKIYLDMDGVLADFVGTIQGPEFLNGPLSGEEHYDQNKKDFTEKGLFKKLTPLPDMQKLVDYAKSLGVPCEILTCAGVVNHDMVCQDKTDWIRKYVDQDMPVHITKKGVEKAKFAQPGYVLVDDRLKNINAWKAAGGTGILHLNAVTTNGHLETLMGVGNYEKQA